MHREEISQHNTKDLREWQAEGYYETSDKRLYNLQAWSFGFLFFVFILEVIILGWGYTSAVYKSLPETNMFYVFWVNMNYVYVSILL